LYAFDWTSPTSTLHTTKRFSRFHVAHGKVSRKARTTRENKVLFVPLAFFLALL
jgi:hypothetical protein